MKKSEVEHRNFLNDGSQAGGLGMRRGVGAKAQGTWPPLEADLTASCCCGGFVVEGLGSLDIRW